MPASDAFSHPSPASGPVRVDLYNESGIALPFSEDCFDRLARHVEQEEQCRFDLLELVYLDEQAIIEVNREYLGRHYVTDIITFRYDNPEIGNGAIEGTLYCCAPRISEQARECGETAEREFARVFVHGLLHLCGYDDQTEHQKSHMTGKEDAYLDSWSP